VSPREKARRFVDGELDRLEAEALLAEAERDPSLARALDEARGALSLLAALEPDGAPEVPADLVNEAVLRAVQRKAAEDATEAGAPPPVRWLRAWLRPRVIRLRLTPPLALGALGLLAATLFLAAQAIGSRTAPHEASVALEQPAAGPTPSPPVETETAVRLMLPIEGARSVAVAGDFNDWATDAVFLEDPEGDGVFVGTLHLSPGSYAYMFVVDGERWVGDPYAVNHRDDGFGNRNAVLRID
jgi:hypothetical protein